MTYDAQTSEMRLAAAIARAEKAAADAEASRKRLEEAFLQLTQSSANVIAREVVEILNRQMMRARS